MSENTKDTGVTEGTGVTSSFVHLALRPAIRKRAIRVALVVGTLLALINHGDRLLRMEIDLPTALRIALTYLVPYSVATYSAVQTLREKLRAGA